MSRFKTPEFCTVDLENFRASFLKISDNLQLTFVNKTQCLSNFACLIGQKTKKLFLISDIFMTIKLQCSQAWPAQSRLRIWSGDTSTHKLSTS